MRPKKTAKIQSTESKILSFRDEKKTNRQVDPKQDQFFDQVQQPNELVNPDTQIRSASDLFSENTLPHSHQILNQSRSEVVENGQVRQEIRQRKSGLSCWLIVLLVFLLISLIKSTIVIVQNQGNQKEESKANLHEQLEQKPNHTAIDPQIKVIQQEQETNQNSYNQKIGVKQPENNKLPLKQNPTLKQNATEFESSNSSNNQTQETIKNLTHLKDSDTAKNQTQLATSSQSKPPSIPSINQPTLNLTSSPQIQYNNNTNHTTITDTQTNIIQNLTNPISTPKQNPLNQTYQHFTLRPYFRSSTPPLSPIDKYEYNSSSDDLVANSALKKNYRDAYWLPHQKQIGVQPAQHQRSIRLLELTHNIDFTGNFIMDHFNFYSSPKEKYDTLKKLMEEEKEYFEKTYNISKYINEQVRFCVYTPSFNNAHNRIYLRNLDSIFQQEYTNYHLIYVDDASTDGTGDYVEKYMIENKIPPSMYTIVRNKASMKGAHNIYVAGNNYCKPGEIMVLVDGDDMIIGRQVFALLNAYYQQNKPAIVYTQFLFIRDGHIGNATNREIDVNTLVAGNWRKKRDFVSWHLKTFYTDLFRMIKQEDMKLDDQWIMYSSDVAYMTPMIEMAGTRLKFLTQTVYQYRHDTGFNEPSTGFAHDNPKIFNKQPYKYVPEMPFILNPITTHYEKLPDEEKKIMQDKQNISQISVQYYDPAVYQTQVSAQSPINSTKAPVTSNSSETQTLKQPAIKQLNTKNQSVQNTLQESIKPKPNETFWKVRQKFRQHVPFLNQTIDLYDFKQSSDELVANSALKKFYNDSPWLKSQDQYGVGPQEHQRAIRLMEVTHNVNFKGQFIFDHFNHYKSAEEKYWILMKLLRQQRKYYEQKYEISKYLHNQLRFCVLVTSYNNMKSRIYLRNLDSIFQQQYKNYHVVYVNDASNDGTKEYVEKYMEENLIPSEMYTLINNQKNMLNTHNTYMAAHNQCKLGQIMVLVDGDDALIGRQVFALLNAFYQREKPALVYTQLLFVYSDHIGNSRNQPINTTIFETTGAWRKQYSFCTSHLKTFYVDLFRMIKKEDLQFEKDEWIPHSPDVAYMTPMLEMAGHRVKFLTEITYEYRHDTNANQPVQGFRKANPKIFAKKPYSLVKDLHFADNQITTFYP